jgi:hypothetical protein
MLLCYNFIHIDSGIGLTMYDVAVIGAGLSGTLAAIEQNACAIPFL